MDIGHQGLVRQRLEFVPRPACRRSTRTADREIPRRERGMWGRTGRENGEVRRLVLTGRETAGYRLGLSAAAKSSRDERLCHDVVLPCLLLNGGAGLCPVEPNQNPAKPWGLL